MTILDTTPPSNAAAARRNMVEGQLAPNQIVDPALTAAMAGVPREAFVTGKLRSVAYLDEDLALGEGRYLMEPMVLGRLLQEAAPQKGEKALVVACGSGYGAAILAHLGLKVRALECDAALAQAAKANLAPNEGIEVSVVTGPLAAGDAAAQPFDVVFIEAAVEEVPRALLDQLAEGGRLVTVVRAAGGVGKATLFLRAGESLARRSLFDAATPLLPARIPGFRAAARFVF